MARHDSFQPATEPPASLRTAHPSRVLAVLLLPLVLVACSPPADVGGQALMLWTFDTDLEGWQTGTADDVPEYDGWGTALWRDWCGSDRERGCVILDGVGGVGTPNAWIWRTLDLPAAATTLSFLTTAHNAAGADSSYRVRLVTAGDVEHVLVPWTVTSGDASGYGWEPVAVDIAAFAGQSVTLYFEGADNGPGFHEQRYYDDIAIH